MVLVQERCEMIYVPRLEHIDQGVHEFELRRICGFQDRHRNEQIEGASLSDLDKVMYTYIVHPCLVP